MTIAKMMKDNAVRRHNAVMAAPQSIRKCCDCESGQRASDVHGENWFTTCSNPSGFHHGTKNGQAIRCPARTVCTLWKSKEAK